MMTGSVIVFAAGGGSFLSVPALMYVGIPSVSANMSSTVALYPGSLASAWAYRGEFQTILDVPIEALFLTTPAGGFAGALMLLLTWLLLLGSLAFAFGPSVGARLERYGRPNGLFLMLAQFLLGIYGGYFGGAAGIMTMAVWSLLGPGDIKAMNASKVLLVSPRIPLPYSASRRSAPLSGVKPC
jgi:uncharacterized membrane protein YfcA